MEEIDPTVLARCPSCQLAMRTFGIASMVLDLCHGCEGIWFDTREWDAHASAQGLPRLSKLFRRPRGSSHGRPFCPACVTNHLSLVRVEGVSLLVCFDCRGCFVPGYQLKVLREKSRRPQPPGRRPPSAAASREEDPEGDRVRLFLELLGSLR